MGKKRRLGTAPIFGIIPTESNKTTVDARNDDITLAKSNVASDLPKTAESSKRESLSFPIRCSEKLYAVKETYDCAMNLGCVPCAYKIGCFDVALDKEFCKARPNQRPEQCPRSSSSNQQNRKNGVMGFHRGMSILTVGDGDFSFSLGLARALLGQQSSQNSRNNSNDETILVATSYESEATLRKVYPDFERTLCELKTLGVHVAYNVDATRILETLPNNTTTAIKSPRFHRICWNFPCTAIDGGQDGQNKAMEDNKELVRNFVESSKKVLRTGGELYVCHKTKPPYNQWDLETVALEKQQKTTTSNQNSKLYYSGRIVLDRFLLPPYTPRKALDKKSFPCHDACFYVFAQEANTKTKKRNKIVFEPTIPRDDQEETCDSSTLTSNVTSSSATKLVKIEPKLLCRLRQKHMSNAAASSAKKSRKSKKQKTNHKKRNNYFAPPQRF